MSGRTYPCVLSSVPKVRARSSRHRPARIGSVTVFLWISRKTNDFPVALVWKSRVLVSWKKAEVKEKKMGKKIKYFAVGNVGIGALASSPGPPSFLGGEGRD